MINLSTWNADNDSLDGFNAWNPGDRILVKDQATASENGIYVTQNDGSLTRAADEQTPAKGDFVFVESGTANAKTGWILGNSTTEWTQFSAAGEYTAGSNITISGNSIAVSDAPTLNNPTVTVGSGFTIEVPTSQSIVYGKNYGDNAPVVGFWWDGGGITDTRVLSLNPGDTITIPSPLTGAGTYTITGVYTPGVFGNTNKIYSVDNTANTLPSGIYGSAANLVPTGYTVTVNSGSTITVSSTEISYLDGVTSNIQTQLDAKQDTLASTTDVSVKTVTTQNADGVSSKVVAFGNTTDTTYAMGSDVTVETLAAATKATDIFLQILDNSGNARTSKLTAVFNGGSAPIWTEYGVVDSGTTIAATVSFDSSKHIIVNVTGSGTYAVRGTATSLL